MLTDSQNAAEIGRKKASKRGRLTKRGRPSKRGRPMEKAAVS